jgi:hypothetical protein
VPSQAPAAEGGRAAPGPQGSATRHGDGQSPQAHGAGTGAAGDRSASAGEEFIERDRAGVASIYFFDNRTYGVYAEGAIKARSIAGSDMTVGPGGRPDGDQTVRPVSVVAVADRDRERLKKVAIGVGRRDQAASMLQRERLIVLHGPEGVGKGVAGLWLLGFDHEVLSVDPSLTARDLTDFGRRFPYGTQRRYLIEALSPATAAQLTSFVLRAAARELEVGDSYLVITVDDRIPLSAELERYVVSWPDKPDVGLALRAHLDYYLGDGAVPAAEDSYDLARFDVGLATRPMRSINEVALLVADGIRKSRPFDSVLDEAGFAAADQVAGWFASQERSPSDIGFLLAAAVLYGCTYSTVSQHARRLEQMIAKASRIRLSGLQENPRRARWQRLQETMTVLRPGFVETEYGQSPADMVELQNRWLVQAVLDAVWHEYDLLTDAMLSWLLETGDDPDPAVRMRTASAAGWLSQYDFAALRKELFLPWARGSSSAAWAAADALGLAAWQESTAPLVLSLLSVWAWQDDDYDLWWTAAVAYGGEVGVRHQGVAMDHLLDIAGKPDGRAPDVVAQSVVRLVSAGGRFAPEIATFVLTHLTNWENYSQAAAVTAQTAYAEMLRRASDANWPSSRDFWRLLTSAANLSHSANLLRAVLNGRAMRTDALESIEILARAAHQDQEIHDELADLLTCVASTGGNDRDRLVHYLGRWAEGSDPAQAAGELADLLKKVTASS